MMFGMAFLLAATDWEIIGRAIGGVVIIALAIGLTLLGLIRDAGREERDGKGPPLAGGQAEAMGPGGTVKTQQKGHDMANALKRMMDGLLRAIVLAICLVLGMAASGLAAEEGRQERDEYGPIVK